MQSRANPFGSRATLETMQGSVTYYDLAALVRQGLGGVDRLPMTVKVFLENVLRHTSSGLATEEDVAALAGWTPGAPERDIPFLPTRVVMQDFTGVPGVVDLAAMRSAVQRLGSDPQKINPLVPVDLVIDHSVQVDSFRSTGAFAANVEREFERNGERYALLRWAQGAFTNLHVVPPGTGIVHQVNLEYLAPVVGTQVLDGRTVAMPDSLVGTDSHTTMINGLGVVGWGVGGIEAEAVMLGQPIYLLTPEVIGFRFSGRLPEGTTATDLVLTVVQMLRKHGVVGKFVEFTGAGLSSLSLPDRATIANMAPEYGATQGLFPIDDETLRYLRGTGRPAQVVELVELYARAQGLFRTDASPEPIFNEVLELDLSTVEPCVAGPRSPQARVPLSGLRQSFEQSFAPQLAEHAATNGSAPVTIDGTDTEMRDGAVAIAAITSCTNTSNPSVMLGAGLLARKAVERGLSVKPYVKTSLAPGSRAVTEYLQRAGVMEPLEALGFYLVGYGCTTCIGNSGPLPPEVDEAIRTHDLVAAAVLSGNRNFEGRIHPLARAMYLASPPLVVAFALAGTVDIDLANEPLGTGSDGKPVFLREIWPTQEEVRSAIASSVSPEMFAENYARVFQGDEHWRSLPVPQGALYQWDESSTYVHEPPFFQHLDTAPAPIAEIHNARVLAMLGDMITTDHISPAGPIAKESPAGRYLQALGVLPADFNQYGTRRGNDQVMVRGTFANIRLRNELAGGKEGGWTTHQPSGALLAMHDAAVRYRTEGVPLLVIAGKEYGAGSSRDWAAKGTLMLGVKAVLAESYERIHRSNLVGMGVLPLQFLPGESRQSLRLTGTERYTITGLTNAVAPGQQLQVVVLADGGAEKRFAVRCRLDSQIEVEYYRHGGVLPMVLRKLVGIES